MSRLPRFAWKKDKVLETKVSVLQGELRQLRWALFGAFSQCARLRAALDAHGIPLAHDTQHDDWSRTEARELFKLAWKYLWSSEALYIDLRAITVVSIDHIKFGKNGFRFTLSHVPIDGLTVPPKARWSEQATWDEFTCTAWSWNGGFGAWTIDFDPRTLQAARVAAKGVDPALDGRERLKELKLLMEEWRQIIAEKTIVAAAQDIES
ncbi:MAG: hypothetical protein AB7Q81_11940 [Gammaproteobacteria bacterium]